MLNRINWSSWNRNEKLTFIGVLVAVIGVLAAIIIPVFTAPSLPSEECILYNDNPVERSVNIRTGCDRKPCDDDPTLIIGAYDNNTKVQRKDTPAVRGKKFNWIQVVILSGGQTVWVADTKVSCKKK